MPAPIYSCPAATVATLTAATARSIIGVKAHANSMIMLVRFEVGFADVVSTEVPGVIQLCQSTFASNSPGTNSTSITPVQQSGKVTAAGFTAASHWTAGNEPTVLTVLRTFPLTPNGGLFSFDYPLGAEPDMGLSEGFVLRLNYAAATDAWATMAVSRA